MESSDIEKKNLYELLGVAPTATMEEIRQVYRELARVYHPDSNFYDEIIPTKASSEQVEVFKVLTAAYNTLTDARKRAEYDEKLKACETRLRDWEDSSSQDFFDDKPKYGQAPKRKRSMTGTFGCFDPNQAEEEANLECRSKTVVYSIKKPQARNPRWLNLLIGALALSLIALIPIAILGFFTQGR